MFRIGDTVKLLPGITDPTQVLRGWPEGCPIDSILIVRGVEAIGSELRFDVIFPPPFDQVGHWTLLASQLELALEPTEYVGIDALYPIKRFATLQGAQKYAEDLAQRTAIGKVGVYAQVGYIKSK